ncbi:MAG: NADH-quinone oxidoreductase subunit M, partial [Steroidobacteraceae bacterium]
LWLVKRVVFGPVGNDHVAALRDVNGREFLVLGVLALAVIALGQWPAPHLNVKRPTIEQLVSHMMVTKL